jgi:hypothetical protein
MLIPPEMVPISGMNALFHCVAGARQAMFTGNQDQRLVTAGLTRKRQRSGLDREFAKGTFSHTFPTDCVVLAVIPRFQGEKFGEDFALNPKDIVIYEDYRTEQLGFVELTKFHVMHQHYGFEFKFREELYERLKTEHRPKFKAGTVIATSPAITDDGDYMSCMEVNVIRMSDPAVTEDAIKISRSFANRMRSTAFETRTFEFGRSHYPINSYGNSQAYRPIPDIGERIQSNGLICALRPFDAKLDAVYMTEKRLFKPVYNLDILTYGKVDAEVVDIKVYHNPHAPNKRLPEAMTRQLRKYYEADRRFYMAIVKACLARRGGVIRESDDIDMTDQLRVLLDEAIVFAGDYLVEEGICDKEYVDILRAKTNYRGSTMDEYRVDITYRYMTSIGDGPKLSDENGGKGVVSQVTEDEDMPIDDFGNRADVVTFDGSTVNRQNNARDHSACIGAAGRDIIRTIRHSYGLDTHAVLERDEVEKVVHAKKNAENGLKQFEWLMGFYKLVAPTGEGKYLAKPSVIPSGRHLRHLVEVILDGNEPYGLFLRMRSDQGLDMAEVIHTIRHSDYCPKMSPVWYVDHAGKRTRTKDSFLIGPNPYMVLEKTAADGSGVSSAKTNHFGVTSKLTNADKHSTPARETGTRSTGEAEARGEAKSVGPGVVADVMEMNNNPVVHKEAVNTILDTRTPTNIPRLIDRRKFRPVGHRPANFIAHHFYCSGKQLSRD